MKIDRKKYKKNHLISKCYDFVWIWILFYPFFLWGEAKEHFIEHRQEIILERRYEEKDAEGLRIYEDVILDCGESGQARFTMSLPKKIPREGLPCVLIVGGLMTGRESLRFIPSHGKYILVAYEYAEVLKKINKLDVLWNLFRVRKAILDVSPQLLSIVKYLEKQPYVCKIPIGFMGYSFGSTFIPVTFVNAKYQSIPLKYGVMAYGGAGLYLLFRSNLPLPHFLKSPVANIAAALFKPIDPILYAPKMKGEFLIINGIYDKQIPFAAAKRLQELVPQPKTIINLKTDHMHPDNKELTLRLIDLSRNWLEEKWEQ